MRSSLNALLGRYPTKQAVVLPALHLVQDQLRCVPLAAVRDIAEMLELSPAEVYDTMTFYGFFRTEEKPWGLHRVSVCRGLACALRGGEELLDGLCSRLGLDPGATTSGGRVTLDTMECLGGCDSAPCMLVNDTLHGQLTLNGAEDRIQELPAERRCLERAFKGLIASIQQRQPPAAGTALQITRSRNRRVTFAAPGSDELRFLKRCRANASVGGEQYTDILLQKDARKVEVLEEFLHGTQYAMGIIQSHGIPYAEIHVKRFMLRHKRWLGISDADAIILRAMVED